MKLRNIFLAGLAVCTMASCSKDDDANGPAAPVDALVSFGVTTEVMTKADGYEAGTDEGERNERLVNQLTALIFDESGKLVGRGDTIRKEGVTESIDKIKCITIKVASSDGVSASNETFTAVLVANVEVPTVATLAAFEEQKTLTIDNYTRSKMAAGTCFLPMVKKVKFSGVKPLGENHTENWINNATGETVVAVTQGTASTNAVVLERLVARVQLEKVSVNFAGGNYKGATFDLKKVFLANVPSTSPLGSIGEENAAALWKGFQSASWEVKQYLIIPSNDNNVKNELAKDLNITHLSMVSANGYTFNTDKPVFYAFAYNGTKKAAGDGITQNYETRLILEGDFKLNSSATAQTRHFHVVLNREGEKKVLPNYMYKITVNITGEGSPNEDEILLNAHVAATIDVAPWNVIEQNESDAN